jgi:uncharacterized protein YndB with AHSA1/START domain
MVQPGELALRMKRVLRAPPSAVFRACTEPEELAKWWGPRGFTTSAIELDLRVGGRYRFAMQPPEGDLFHFRVSSARSTLLPASSTPSCGSPRTQMTGRRS